MALNYEFIYAEIDSATNMCVGIHRMSIQTTNPILVEIPIEDPDYIFKYYIDGNWYEDAEGTIPWESSLV